MTTTFDEIRPIVEGRLYEWGRFMNEFPAPAVSSAYRADGVVREGGYRSTSQQEAWVSRHFDAMRVASVIEQARERLSPEQRLVIDLRYRERRTWEDIAQAIHTERRTAYRIRDEALLILAYELNLLRTSDDDVENTRH